MRQTLCLRCLFIVAIIFIATAMVRNDLTARGEVQQAQINSARADDLGAKDISPLVADDAFVAIASTPNAIVAEVRRDILKHSARLRRPLHVQGFPISQTQAVDLELTPFSVVGRSSRFVVGQPGGPDRAIDFDPERIQFFIGKVSGRPGSHVYLSMSDLASTGYIDMGLGAPRFRISEKDGIGAALARGMISVFEARGATGGPAGVPFCGVKGEKLRFGDGWVDNPPSSSFATTAGQATYTVGRKHFELAVETDYEYFALFNDETTALNYLLQMYGEVSSIYIRDINVHMEVVFARLWNTPNDLFNAPDAIFQIYPYWQQNMGHIPRDAVQLLSGRRDYPYGGIAFLRQLCSMNFAFSTVGYVLGFMPDPTRPDPYNWDVSVCAHEIGHTFDARHTHDHGLDTCDDPNTTPRRGSIMGYCGQTWSGMNANEDNYFHVVNRQEMIAHVNNSPCLVNDCNMNFIDDAIDIALGTSLDVNGNGIPDECEDCNNNGILDPQDIASATSLDLNSNGIPDECEPDCNNNGVPDDRDIALGTSLDVQGDGIPDECETDCNGNSISDYLEIIADMTLDKNRNAILDSCEDCDGNSIDDLTELAGAHGIWVASGLTDEPLRQFHGSVGVLLATSEIAAPVDEGQDVIILPSGTVLVSSAGDDRIAAFAADGTALADFVSSGSGGLDHPAGMAIHPSGDVLVASRETHSVLRYDGTDGSFIGAFVAAGSGGLIHPFGLTYAPNGNLFATSDDDQVLEFDGDTGDFLRVFVVASNNGGLSHPRGLAFKPDGNLLVASFGTDQVLQYDGRTGWPRGKWAFVGTATAITQDSPWGIRVGPNGHVYVTRTGTGAHPHRGSDDVSASHLTDARMFEYHACTGNHRSTVIGGNDHGLDFATGFAFIPGWGIDCNLNQLPDNCDIDSGYSLDVNENGVPDECEIDCNNNGIFDRFDIWPHGTSLDCNCNGIPDECDIASSFSEDCNGNGIPDECEPAIDCDGNSIQDICDIALGNGEDCNENGFLDACELALPSSGIIFSEDFEGGLPAGWTATGIFQVTGDCEVAPACEGTSWAYAGSTTSCTYGNGQAGAIVSPPILIPPNARAELRYCSALQSEAGFDFADVVVNNTIVRRISGGTGIWENQIVDLTAFAGQSVTLMFRLESDVAVSGTLGWQVDNIQVFTEAGAEDCNENDIPDVCESDPGCFPSVQPEPDGVNKARFVSFAVSAASGSVATALRVEFDSIASPPGAPTGSQIRYLNAVGFNGDNHGAMSIDCPDVPTHCPNFACAVLGCEPEYRDWAAEVAAIDPIHSVIHVTGNAVVPSSTYSVLHEAEGGETSASMQVSTAVWGDVLPAFGVVNVVDLGGVKDWLVEFSNAPCKMRVWMRNPPNPFADVNVIDLGNVGNVLAGNINYPGPAITTCP